MAHETRQRKIALVINNCPAHPNIQVSLNAVKLVFLPPNTTVKLQPCDQGIIQNLKVQYRKYLLIKLFAAIEDIEDFSQNLLDALYLLRLSWENVSVQTIANCFHHCGFTHPDDNATSQADVLDTADGPSLLRRLNTSEFELPNKVTFENFVDVDSEVISTAALTDEDIALIVQKEDIDICTDDEEIDDSPVPPPPPTAREVDKSLSILRQYFEPRDPAVGENCLLLVAKLEKNN